MSTGKKSIFIGDDGTNLMFTFILVSSLFLLWGFCNGMIDVMDKHFQEELGLNKSQSAWVQFAHYLGYFLMSLPAGWLASRLGYKGGIIAGLLIVALGGFWFIPATQINALVHEGRVSSTTAFVAFLAGVCIIATGLTFLETNRVEIITGVNLPMLIKLAGMQSSSDLLAVAREMRENGRNAIWVASDLLHAEAKA